VREQRPTWRSAISRSPRIPWPVMSDIGADVIFGRRHWARRCCCHSNPLEAGRPRSKPGSKEGPPTVGGFAGANKRAMLPVRMCSVAACKQLSCPTTFWLSAGLVKDWDATPPASGCFRTPSARCSSKRRGWRNHEQFFSAGPSPQAAPGDSTPAGGWGLGAADSPPFRRLAFRYANRLRSLAFRG
jgi:hypothetical protein